MTTFEDLVGDRTAFFADHFRNTPLFRTAAMAHQVESILSVEQMNDVIELEAMSPSYLRIMRLGKAIAPKRYTRTIVRPGQMMADAVDPAKVHTFYRDGATITLNSLEHFLPPVRQLLRSATEPFAAGGEAVAFLTPAGNPGFAPHTDPVDIFVVQIEGSKAWRLWDRVPVGTAVTAENLGPARMEVTLRAGDVLYMPPLTPHAAVAQDDVSLHLGLSIEPRRWRDLIHECLDALMDDGYQDSPYLGPEHATDSAAGFAALLGDLATRIGSVDPTEELSRLVGTGARGRSADAGFAAPIG
jgi:bifunctional lysine-specific demethylase and histidyl-hydroxylase NO66